MTLDLMRGSRLVGVLRPREGQPMTLQAGSAELLLRPECADFAGVAQARTPAGLVQIEMPVLDLVAVALAAQRGEARPNAGARAGPEAVATPAVEPSEVLAIRDAKGHQVVPDFLQVVKMRTPAGMRGNEMLASELWQMQWGGSAT